MSETMFILARSRSSSCTPRASNSVSDSRTIVSISASVLPAAGLASASMVNWQASSAQPWLAWACTASRSFTRFL